MEEPVGSSGGGSSGKVSYAAYLQETHSDWLNKGSGGGIGSDTIETSVTAVMNAALGGSPFLSAAAYDPTTDLTTAAVPLTTLQALTPATLFSDALAQIPLILAAIEDVDSTALIAANVAAYTDVVDNEVETSTLPKFRRGMQDINAVMSSAFVIGEALIYAEKDRNIAKYTSDLELRAFTEKNQLFVHVADFQLRALLASIEFHKTVVHYSTEYARVKITSKKEQVESDIEIGEKDAQWDLRVFQAGGNLMAAIHGASSTVNSKPNSLMSALGGALSGVGMGASIGGPPGALVGGLLGGISSLF